MIRSRKHLSACPTGVGFDPRVKPHVAGQHVRTGEGSLAHVTCIGLGPTATAAAVSGARFVSGRHVLGQAIMQGETLTADGAHIRYVRIRPRDRLYHWAHIQAVQ